MQIVDRLHEQRQLIEDQNVKIEGVEKSIAEQDSRRSAVEQRIDFFVKASQTPTGGILATGDTVYHFGASFKDMGNEMTAYSVLNFVTPEEVIEKVQESTNA